LRGVEAIDRAAIPLLVDLYLDREGMKFNRRRFGKPTDRSAPVKGVNLGRARSRKEGRTAGGTSRVAGLAA